ncbi:DUF2004 domain-containing protein [Moraxella bovis]|uniref:DUF2004 domain-containing protein n=1 Tax=Moraxella bovis TaxID=476 RepID=A0AAQ2Q0Q8_MORBO|nr:DUF2004 domain-containing protein [Moraxella bovis]AWY20683.1 hypothetical protein DQF64_09405 [Moraxella bovis]UYZ76639.1 DUF2004 domain-containing protein [Moraxella bovis]UYZ77409.1 DUF2004 domain-containing protein [Moraxella bovis]UYZ82112.1 DUF2004 domain-containing protein [Moraxella bovis]UYZ85895.1 DUF2004 domain-containing protein [Moraxella bovis]
MTTHSYFGELNLGDWFIWRSNISIPQIQENPIVLLLEVNSGKIEPTTDFLDKSAKHFQNIESLHQKAVIELINYLNDDDYFIDEHIEQCDLPALTALIESDDLTNENFVKLLKLQSVSGWYGENCQIVMDYMIDPEQSDRILAVKFDLDGNFNKVSWES